MMIESVDIPSVLGALMLILSVGAVFMATGANNE